VGNNNHNALARKGYNIMISEAPLMKKKKKKLLGSLDSANITQSGKYRN
jgi:hypothetical protein